MMALRVVGTGETGLAEWTVASLCERLLSWHPVKRNGYSFAFIRPFCYFFAAFNRGVQIDSTSSKPWRNP